MWLMWCRFYLGGSLCSRFSSILSIVSLVSRQQPGQKGVWISLPLMKKILRTLSSSPKFLRYFLPSDVVHDWWMEAFRCARLLLVSWELMKLGEVLFLGPWSMASHIVLWTGGYSSSSPPEVFLLSWGFYPHQSISGTTTSRPWASMTARNWQKSNGRSCFKR